MRLVTQTRSVARLIRARSESSSIKNRLSQFFISLRSILSCRVRFFLSHRYMYGMVFSWSWEKKREREASRERGPTWREWKPATSWTYTNSWLPAAKGFHLCASLRHRCCSGFKSNCIVRREIFAGVQRCADVVIDFQRLLMVCNGMNPIACGL